jgi:hypothetical protein
VIDHIDPQFHGGLWIGDESTPKHGVLHIGLINPPSSLKNEIVDRIPSDRVDVEFHSHKYRVGELIRYSNRIASALGTRFDDFVGSIGTEVKTNEVFIEALEGKPERLAEMLKELEGIPSDVYRVDLVDDLSTFYETSASREKTMSPPSRLLPVITIGSLALLMTALLIRRVKVGSYEGNASER